MELLFLRARWYGSETGTFLSVDSVESEPPYLYVGGNPINLVDPSGYEGFCFQGAPRFDTMGPESPIYQLCQILATKGLLGYEGTETSGYYRYNNDEAGKAKAISAVKNSKSDRTVVIGYSWGGAAALEVARQLDQEGVAIDDLILIDPVIDGIEYKRTAVSQSASLFSPLLLFPFTLCDIELNNQVRQIIRGMDGRTPSSVPPNTSRALSLYSTVRRNEANGIAPILLYGSDNIVGAVNRPIENSNHQSIMQTNNVVNPTTQAEIVQFLDPPKPLQSAPLQRSLHNQTLNPEHPIPLQSAPEN